MTVQIIGTDPPCPRCGLLFAVVEEIMAEMGLSPKPRHLVYSGDEALAIAGACGLVPGTAKAVAQAIGRPIPAQSMTEVMAHPPQDPSHEYHAFASFGWSPALDDLLRPFEEAAPGAGILMTPVLVVDGRVVHRGSVPSRRQIEAWLTEGGEGV